MRTLHLALLSLILIALGALVGLDAALAQSLTSSTSTATSFKDIAEAGAAIVSAFDTGVLAGIEAILLTLAVAAHNAKIQAALKMRPVDKLDFIPPLLLVILGGFSAGAAASLISPWYAAVISGIIAALASAPFTGFLKEVQDKPGEA